jgi:hypothetical protein
MVPHDIAIDSACFRMLKLLWRCLRAIFHVSGHIAYPLRISPLTVSDSILSTYLMIRLLFIQNKITFVINVVDR